MKIILKIEKGDKVIIIVEVLLSNGQIKYMSIQKSPYENSAIVIVNANKFLELWKNEPNSGSGHYEIANGNPETWRKDKKYLDAEIGFAQGQNNPVPLPEVSFYEAGFIKMCPEHVKFTNGVIEFALISFLKRKFDR